MSQSWPAHCYLSTGLQICGIDYSIPQNFCFRDCLACADIRKGMVGSPFSLSNSFCIRIYLKVNGWLKELWQLHRKQFEGVRYSLQFEDYTGNLN